MMLHDQERTNNPGAVANQLVYDSVGASPNYREEDGNRDEVCIIDLHFCHALATIAFLFGICSLRCSLCIVCRPDCMHNACGCCPSASGWSRRFPSLLRAFKQKGHDAYLREPI